MKATGVLLDILVAGSRSVNPATILFLWGLCLALLPWALAVDAILFALSMYRVWWWSKQTHIRCPRGHQVALIGAWECRCGFRFIGSGVLACPSCGTTSHLACACGLTVRGPLVEEER